MHRIERTAAGDLMFLAVQGSVVPEQFGAVLVLDPKSDFDVAAATRMMGERVRAVPRLRQRVMRVAPWCGRAVWVDDAAFSIEGHVEQVACPSPGDERALLDLAGSLVARPLQLDRPLWAATFVTGLDGRRMALVIVVQHALADGIGGLAVLGALVDGAEMPVRRDFPVPPPTARELAVDAFRTRVRATGAALLRIPSLCRFPPRTRALRIGRAEPCSLLRPTGPRRRVTAARTAVADLRAVAHDHGATVNDAMLTAVTGALHATMEARGEYLTEFVVAVPISERARTSPEALGNRFRETRALLPGDGSPVERLERVATIMQIQKVGAFGPSVATIASAVVRVAAAVGVYDRYMRRQRYLHTVATNVRGPDTVQAFCGATISEIIPLAVGGGGNVTVTFAAISYAGTLAVSLTADPDVMTDLDETTAALQAQLDALSERLPAEK